MEISEFVSKMVFNWLAISDKRLAVSGLNFLLE